MSRFTIRHNKYTYAYGEDHVLGLFFEKTFFKRNEEKTVFDISEFVNFVPHPKFPQMIPNLSTKREDIIKAIEWEIENEGLPFNLEHLELIKKDALNV